MKSDLEVDAFMRASARSGKRHSIRTDYTLRMLGLDVRYLPESVALNLAAEI